MRRITTIATTLMMTMALSGAALAARVEGNNANDTLTGTNQADTIHSCGGQDVVWALSGRDQVRGGSNADQLYGQRYGDTLFGGKGQDRLYGGYGDDHLVGRDLNSSGIGQRDVLDCGPGYDTFAADYEDRVLDNCEEGSVGGF